MILEGLVTTIDLDGSPHLAPMGPRVWDDFSRFTLRPFPTSQTCRNLLRHRQGVFHVTDDALLLARAAIGPVVPFPATIRAERIEGFILTDCCRHYEFAVRSVDASAERLNIEVDVVSAGRRRDFFGFNRAKHAVVEAAILATRLHLIPHAEIAADFAKLRAMVAKTGGPAEFEAMDLLEAKLRRAEAAR
jgi:hypothetical protein